MSSTLLMLMATDLIVLACIAFAPIMRGPDAFFGIRVSPETYSGEGRRLLHRYWFWLAMLFVEVQGIGLLISYARGRFEYAQIAPQLLLIPLAILLYVIFYRKARSLEYAEPSERVATSLTVRRLADYTNLGLEILVLVLTITPIALLIYYYPQLPERIPTHWNWKGEPDSWTRKSYFSVFSLAAMLVYMQGVMIFVKQGLLGVKMTLPAEHTEAYLRLKEESLLVTIRLIDWMRVLTCVLLGTLTANVAFTAVDQLRGLSTIAFVLEWAAGISMFLVLVWFAYKFYRIDRRLKSEVGRVYVQRQKDAAHWYLGGLFYFNREDPALWVEKLVGWGYTFNMGNKWVYLYLAIMLGVPLLLFLPLESLGS